MMGDVNTELAMSTDADTVAGLNALRIFWQNAQALNPAIPRTFDGFLDGLKQALVPTDAESAWPGYVGPYYPTRSDEVFKIKVAGIGGQVNVGGNPAAEDAGLFSFLTSGGGSDVVPMNGAQVEASMRALAEQGGGRIPADINAFTAALRGQATQVGFMESLWYTTVHTVSDVAEGVVAAGEAIKDTASQVIKYKNYVLIGAAALAALILYARFGGGLRLKRNPCRHKQYRA